MSEWVSKPLGEIITVQKGRKVDTSPHPLDGYREYLGAGALSGSSDGYASTFLAVQADETDVLMLWDGERSGLCRTGLSGVVSSTVAKLTPTGAVDSLFLYYVLLRQFGWIQHRRTGTGVPHVPRDIERVLTVSYPRRKDEQRNIARILQTIDRAIEKTETLIDKYQQIKAGLMQDLLTRGIRADGQLRPPRTQAPELYEETTSGWIPKDWQISPLREMARPGTPHVKTGPFGSSLKGEHWKAEGIPVITIGALGEGEFLHEELLYISENYANQLADYRMKQGEVVFSRVADVGRSVVIEAEQEGWVMSSNLMRIHLDSSKANPHFLQNLLSFDSRVRTQVRCKVNSSGRDVANAEILNSILFAWPPKEEQDAIVNRAIALHGVISKEQELKKTLVDEKSGLMHDLLTGKVPVHVEDSYGEAEAAHV